MFIVDNGSLRLAFLPTVGGRLISLEADGRELLWRGSRYVNAELEPALPVAQWPQSDGTFASWANVGGSKTWPAPQGWGGEGEWAGPPDPVLDSGAWSLEVAESAAETVVTMASAEDPRTGIQITKRFVVPADGPTFSEHIQFVNVSDRQIEWSIWEVAQVDTSSAVHSGGVIVVSVDDNHVVDLGTYHGAVGVQHGEGHAVIAVQDVVAKLGFPSGNGSIAYRESSGFGVELTFATISGAAYPDEGSRAEVWMQSPIDEPIAQLGGLHPDAWLVELEVLSPLQTLAPGEAMEFALTWRVTGVGGTRSG